MKAEIKTPVLVVIIVAVVVGVIFILFGARSIYDAGSGALRRAA